MTQDSAETLTDIQRAQFQDRARAESLLLEFLRRELPELETLTIHTKPESLNSINGIMRMGGKDFFFKTHTEEHETERESFNKEFYNSKLLEQQGYPVVTPELVRHIPGRQIAVYQKVEMQTLFDLAKQVEDQQLAGEASPLATTLVSAQERLDQRIFEIYCNTISETASTTDQAPIHQLFSGRLEPGKRVDEFYDGQVVALPFGDIAFDDLKLLPWTINGVDYDDCLQTLIERARTQLDPKRPTLTVCGHGDAHNGNVWFEPNAAQLWYFDPAFAGYHSPLLDMVKPLFHNVFARWMYHPAQVQDEFEVTAKLAGGRLVVEHNYSISELRQGFLRSKVQHALRPTVAFLAERGHLPAEWHSDLKLALLCCPLLTVNLAARQDPQGKLEGKYSTAIKMLGLCMAIEAGAHPTRGSNPIQELLGTLQV